MSPDQWEAGSRGGAVEDAAFVSTEGLAADVTGGSLRAW
jgi:hypothetical protein